MPTGFEEGFEGKFSTDRITPIADVLRDVRTILPGERQWWPWPAGRGNSGTAVDVPPPKPEQGWFSRLFTGAGETIGGFFGGAIGGVTRPLMPLLVMVAVIGVIAFLVLGRLQR